MIFIGSKKKFYKKYVDRKDFEAMVSKWSQSKQLCDELLSSVLDLKERLNHIENDSSHYFKAGLGDTVYDVQYRTKAGRFCSKKEKASKSRTTYTEKQVTEDNFMSVQQAIKNKEMFVTELEAIRFIETLSD